MCRCTRQWFRHFFCITLLAYSFGKVIGVKMNKQIVNAGSDSDLQYDSDDSHLHKETSEEFGTQSDTENLAILDNLSDGLNEVSHEDNYTFTAISERNSQKIVPIQLHKVLKFSYKRNTQPAPTVKAIYTKNLTKPGSIPIYRRASLHPSSKAKRRKSRTTTEVVVPMLSNQSQMKKNITKPSLRNQKTAHRKNNPPKLMSIQNHKFVELPEHQKKKMMQYFKPVYMKQPLQGAPVPVYKVLKSKRRRPVSIFRTLLLQMPLKQVRKFNDSRNMISGKSSRFIRRVDGSPKGLTKLLTQASNEKMVVVKIPDGSCPCKNFVPKGELRTKLTKGIVKVPDCPCKNIVSKGLNKLLSQSSNDRKVVFKVPDGNSKRKNIRGYYEKRAAKGKMPVKPSSKCFKRGVNGSFRRC